MKDSNGPTARDISKITKGRHKEREVIKSEIEMMKGIGWALTFSTAAEYIELFQNQGCLFQTDRI